MTTIETPQGPGVFISRWRNEGPVDSDALVQWKDELAWPSWLSLAEAALFMDAPELLDAMSPHLSAGELAVLGLVRRRWLGDTHLDEAIESALEVVRNPETRDLALEGRLRPETQTTLGRKNVQITAFPAPLPAESDNYGANGGSVAAVEQ